ncbi:MAG: VCBS repeat-containing protein [Microscillaceae bacterium]|nr:VCBS repeat-containing protein [Microscillaceae bacterium]
MKHTLPYVYFWGIIFICFACSGGGEKTKEPQIFKLLSSTESGVTFENTLTENDSVNYFTYPYLYMGGGVSIGDINNDGLADIYLTGNMVKNKLYLNKGNMKFEDISAKAGVEGDSRWMTGCTMADVNGDGFLDIYVSVSGKSAPRENLLYINNGDLTFTEKAKEYGVADPGNSTQATFFDYDQDNDLDLFVANYPITPFSTPNGTYRYLMDNVTLENSSHLYRNEGGEKFTDVTKDAGMLNFGLSLSATSADINQDGWADLYVSNDFSTPDFFYINNGDGTFSEKLREATRSTSMFGMGTDIGDFNNDGLLDIVQMDMNPADNRRNKANMASMNPDLFWSGVQMGFHYQYMQNSLQLNNGLHNGLPNFSNIARLAGISSTDWSWTPLFVDLDNDGWKDIFISNGTRRDINNKDFFHDVKEKPDLKKNPLKYALQIPSEKVDNYAFKNNGDLTFSNVIKDWGLSFEGFSNGAAYGDLDNDGDLDLIVSNIDSLVSIFENQTSNLKKNHFLQFKPKGPQGNVFALGTKVEIKTGKQIQVQELTMTRGFQSSVQPLIHFGLGTLTQVEQAVVTWPDGKQQILKNLKADQIIELKYTDAQVPQVLSAQTGKPLFEEISQELGVEYLHREDNYNDFEYEPLLPHSMSKFGPGLATGDVNGDKLEDFFVGAATNSTGKLYLQTEEGKFEPAASQPWQLDSLHEDMGAAFFDAEGDGDLDLYVVSGGNSYRKHSPNLQDRLYLNDGKGNFEKNKTALPKMQTSGSCVIPADFDGDGDMDLFVGGRVLSQSYPRAPRSYILRNESVGKKIKFTDITSQIAPELAEVGMVTDAEWVDYDGDKDLDLVVVGEWMPLSFFKNEKGKFKNMTQTYGLEKTTGWWFSIQSADFDKDGDRDFIVGNLGLNYKYRANEKESFDVYSDDFDKNGRLDIVLGYYNNGIQYPVRGRQCSSEQIPIIQYKFETYNEFASATLEDVYSEQNLKTALHYQAWTFATSYVENLGNGKFAVKKMPNFAQLSSVNDFITEDFNQDGNLDIILAGNLHASEVETPRNDAGIGLLLLGNGKGDFSPVSMPESGILLKYDLKKLALIKSDQHWLLLAANSNGPLQIYGIKPKKQGVALVSQVSPKKAKK